MKWNLEVEVELKDSFSPIKHRDRIVSFGSCFSQNIGDRLSNLQFPIDNNPFGTLYNPLSISKGIKRVSEGRLYNESELVEFNDSWHSMDHHSKFSSTEKKETLDKINNSITAAHSSLNSASTIIVTFGTSFYYKLIETDEVVGNCHKMPSISFQRKMLDTDAVVKEYSKLITQIEDINPHLQWIFTVSPIRHWKDGAAGNSWSKANLISAARALEQQFRNVHYFPAYEIMMDELRDYRFYAEDLVHPNQQAIDFIWENFYQHCVDDRDHNLIEKIKSINSDLNHKPIQINSVQHQKFMESLQLKISGLISEYPYLQFNI